MPQKIEVGHCYVIRAVNGRLILAEVTKLIERPIRQYAADGSCSVKAIPTARFRWRPGDFAQQQLPLEVFTRLATCS